MVLGSISEMARSSLQASFSRKKKGGGTWTVPRISIYPLLTSPQFVVLELGTELDLTGILCHKSHTNWTNPGTLL